MPKLNQNQEKAAETITHKSNINLVLVERYINKTAAQDVMNVAARASELSVIPLCLFPFFSGLLLL